MIVSTYSVPFIRVSYHLSYESLWEEKEKKSKEKGIQSLVARKPERKKCARCSNTQANLQDAQNQR